MKKNLKNRRIMNIIVILFLLVTGGLIFYFLPNMRSQDYREYLGFDSDNVQMVLEDQYVKTDKPPVIVDDNIYISFEFSKEYIDPYLYWDDQLRKLIITTENEVIRFNAEETQYYVNNEPVNMTLPVNVFDNVPYLPVDLLESMYSFSFEYNEPNNIVIVRDTTKEENIGTLKSNTSARYYEDKKALITKKLKKGEQVIFFHRDGEYYKIRSVDGLLGYIKKDSIIDEITIGGDKQMEKTYLPPIDGKVTLAWDAISIMEANHAELARSYHVGVNVLSPTWFKFNRDTLDGEIVSLADTSYVQWAHENGYQVWGLLSDIEDGYDTVVSNAILPDSDKRESAIKQILSFIAIYDLDGINIDFEQVTEANGENFLQFIRELYPYMKAEGKILSIDTFVPSPWTQYYNRTDLAKSSDYIIVMAYDEHISGDDIGPVASIDFVEKGIRDSLAEVPKEKLLLGLPFYGRIWATTEEADGTTSSRRDSDKGMDTTRRQFEKNNAEFQWDPETGYNYGEYTITDNGNNVIYKTWLEDKDSIELKLKLYEKYDLQGVAGWRRGLEGDGIWELVDSYVN